MSGLYQEIADLGIERAELARMFGQAKIGGEMISFEPKELGSMVTTIRAYGPKRYLSVDAFGGAARFIKRSASIPEMVEIKPEMKLDEIKKMMRNKDLEPFDLVSLDVRGFSIPVDELWKYLLGGKETAVFGKGAPVDYGNAKLKSGTLIIFNFSSEAIKHLYFKERTLDNKVHQSQFAGMIKWL